MTPPLQREPLSLADAPDVCDVQQFASIIGRGEHYCRFLVREGYVVNCGTARNYRIPKLSIGILLEQVARREVVLPEDPQTVRLRAKRQQDGAA